MKIFLVRHAAAIERSAGVSEDKRYLTPEGRIFFRKTARTMLDEGVEPDLILTSPLLRAVQTADILAESLSYNGPLAVVNELEPGFDVTMLEKLLKDCQQVRELVLVGHEPDMSSMITSLLSLSAGFSFRKGAAIKLKIDPANLQAAALFKWLAVGDKLITSREEALG